MKSLVIAVASLLISTVASAWDVPGNPDRFVSVGLNVSNSSLKGDHSELDGPPHVQQIQRGHEELESHLIGVDLRIPTTQSLTFNLSYDYAEMNSRYDRSSQLHKVSSNLDGYRWGVGMRFYFNQ